MAAGAVALPLAVLSTGLRGRAVRVAQGCKCQHEVMAEHVCAEQQVVGRTVACSSEPDLKISLRLACLAISFMCFMASFSSSRSLESCSHSLSFFSAST